MHGIHMMISCKALDWVEETPVFVPNEESGVSGE